MLLFVTAVKGEPEEGNEEAAHTDKAQSQENSLAASAKNCNRNVRTARNRECMGIPGCESATIQQTEQGCKHSRCPWHRVQQMLRSEDAAA